jgi:hypothetical protein
MMDEPGRDDWLKVVVELRSQSAHPDDASLAGVYRFDVCPAGRALARSRLADAVLECFHRRIGVACPDDFEVGVFDADDRPVADSGQRFDHACAYVDFCGRVETS